MRTSVWKPSRTSAESRLYSGTVANYRNHPELISQLAQRTYDILIRLAEAIGVLNVENPETEKSWGANGNLDPNSVIARIESVLGISIAPPQVYNGFCGLLTERGVITERMLSGLYTAWRLRTILEGNAATRILEIGAGLGWVAYYAYRMGFTRYSIIDIPVTTLSQAWFLGNALGADTIRFFNESNDGSVTLGTSDMLGAADTQYDMVVNVDSITEVGLPTATRLLSKLRGKCRQFLSINHEVNDYTARSVITSELHPHIIHRHPCWLRNGYVEELAVLGQDICPV